MGQWCHAGHFFRPAPAATMPRFSSRIAIWPPRAWLLSDPAFITLFQPLFQPSLARHEQKPRSFFDAWRGRAHVLTSRLRQERPTDEVAAVSDTREGCLAARLSRHQRGQGPASPPCDSPCPGLDIELCSASAQLQAGRQAAEKTQHVPRPRLPSQP